MIGTVIKLELKKWLPRPLLWVLWAIGFSLISILFYRLCVDYLLLAHRALTDNQAIPSLLPEIVKPLASWSIVLLTLLMPIFTTHAFSQEYRTHSFILWANSPLSSPCVVIGKFLALLLFPLSLMIAEFAMLAVLEYEAHLDIGWLISTFTCMMLIIANVTAFGLFISSISRLPQVTMMLTFVGTLCWMLLEWLNPFPAAWGKIAQYVSLLGHSYAFFDGTVITTDLFYYCASALFWLILTEKMIQRQWVHT